MESETTFGIYEALAILGALAWLPPLIIFLGAKLSKPTITIITAEDIEIGYTKLGPIFNLQIAFLAEKKRALIRTMEIEMTHENSAIQKFTWDWFEETLHEVSGGQFGSIPTKKNQKAIAINIDPGSLVEKKIGFQQNSFKNHENQLTQLVTEEYLNILSAGDDINQIRSRKTFNQLKEYYKNGFNWEIGKYSAKLIAQLSDGQQFKTVVNFQLNSLDLKTIEPNIKIAQTLVEKTYGADLEIEPRWLWVNTRKL